MSQPPIAWSIPDAEPYLSLRIQGTVVGSVLGQTRFCSPSTTNAQDSGGDSHAGRVFAFLKSKLLLSSLIAVAL